MKAIILAAGLGSRLAKLTKNNHKSLIKVGKQSILERLINQFEICGIKKINIICGHKKKKIDFFFPKYKTFFYPNYRKTNNLHTLYFFRRLLNDECIISFSDIILEKKIVKKLIRSKKNITLCIDKSKSRPGTMKIDIIKDKLTYLGNSPKINSGNYIGIMKIKKNSIVLLKKAMKKIKNQSRDLYFTEAINHIIKNKIAKVGYLDVRKNFWTEIDDKNDLLLAKKNLNEKYN